MEKIDIKQEIQVSSEELGKLFGLTSRRVQQLAKQEVLPVLRQKPYAFNLYVSITAYTKYLSEQIKGRESKSSKTAQSKMLEAETDLKRTKADIAALQLAELEGRMHSSGDVEAVMDDLVFAIRSAIMALPGRLAMDAARAATANEASVLIRAECYKILDELSEYRYDPGVYRRRVRSRKGWEETENNDAEREET